MMHYFLRIGTRFVAPLLVLALIACSNDSPITDPGDPDKTLDTESSRLSPPATTPDETPPVEPDPSKDKFAPASRINQGAGGAAAPGTNAANYGPPTHIGEQATNLKIVKVGLLIPMTGDAAQLGHSLLDAAVLAIYDKYDKLSAKESSIRIVLLPKDTSDTIEGAEKASQDAIEEGATLILGPVFSKQVNAVAGIAKHKNIPIISFSNNVTVASSGVYLFGFIPEQQVTRIVEYALQRKVVNIAALVPSNPYGAAIVKELLTEVRKSGGRAHPIEYYAEDLSAVDKNIGRLARFLQDESSKGQGLFIAEGGAKLKILMDKLALAGVNGSNVQLLGSGVWDDPSVLKMLVMQGGWFASSPPERYHAFEQHFIANYKYKPDRLASLSYDAVALAATMAINNDGKGFPASVILDPVGYNGPANGIFRFREDGTIERGLSILQITATGFKAIDPAPSIFTQ